VADVDLRNLSDPDTVGRLRAAVTDHHVVFVRDQHLSEEELRTFAADFGPLGVSPLHRLLGTGRTTSVIEDTAERPPAGFDWHTDLSWTAAPPALGFLTAVTIPPFGGDTMWASLAAAFESLPPGTKAACTRLRARHRTDRSLLESIERHHGPEVARLLRDAHPPVDHPLVRRHPISGRRLLALSPLYTEQVVGLERDTSAHLLATLERTLEDPHHQVRWRWAEGDVAIWDEASTCHRALTDHFPEHRVMRRCVVDGGRPIPA
jgi:taurine dioxygenase